MKNLSTAVFVAILASGCSTVSTTKVVGPNGKPAYALRCSDMGECMVKAGETCPSGYAVLDNRAGQTAVPLNGSVFMMTDHNLSVECK